MSEFVKQQIEKKLVELRYECGLQRLHLLNAQPPRRWSGCPRQDPNNPSSWDLHWENLQAEAQRERPKDVDRADKALADFIAEHRPIMGPGWIGNDHGRLCWASYLGGCPIDRHYCQQPEGHSGPHGNAIGRWPQSVTYEHEWHDLLKTLPKGATGLE